MILRRTRTPELLPGQFYVVDAEGPLATIRMCLRVPIEITIERMVSNGSLHTHPRETIPMRRLDGERWELPPFEVTPGLLKVEVMLDGWDW